MTTQETANITRQIEELNDLTVNQLQKRWVEVWNEPCRSRNKDNLRKRIAWKIQANAYGGLSQRALERARELTDETLLKIRTPQLPHAEGRGETIVHRFTPTTNSLLPPPGALITRRYRDRKIIVSVLDDGFEFDGQVYKSLSAVAKAVTGAHWNGRAFFGLPKTQEAA